MTQPYDVEFASEQYQAWLVALKREAFLSTLNQAQAMMRAVMHALRRSLPARDVLVVANAFPALPRGVFLEGWSLDEERVAVASPDDFHRRVAASIEAHHVPPPSITADAFAVWAGFLGEVRAQAVRSRLPEALRPLWPDRAAGPAASRAEPRGGADEVRIVDLTSENVHLLGGALEGVFDDPVVPEAAAAFASDRRHRLVAALAGGAVIGFVSAVEILHPDKGRPELWINEIGVSGPWRRRGIGARLLRRMLDIGRILGCRSAWVLTERDNKAAMRLYASAGAGEPSDHVMLDFDLR